MMKKRILVAIAIRAMELLEQNLCHTISKRRKLTEDSLIVLRKLQREIQRDTH